MGTTAQKLEYLGTTKSQLKDMINYGLDEDNKITSSTTFRNYVTSIFNAFLESLNNPDTLFTNLPKITGSGANITLDDTANAPMRIMLNATDITQDGTPTPDSPKDIHTISGSNKVVVCGKNLFDVSKISTGIFINTSTGAETTNNVWNISDYISVGNVTSITTSNSILADSSNRFEISEYNGNKQWISSRQYGNNTALYFNLNLNANTKYVRIGYRNDLNFTNIQVELGTITNPTYEPYISQEAEVNLKSTNLFDKDNFTSKANYIKNDNGAETSSTGFSYITSYIPVKPSTQYTLSGSLVDSNNTARVYYYDSSKTWISRSSGFGNGVNICTFITPNNCYYIQFHYATYIFNKDSIMLNEGSAALEYEPYYDINYSKINTYKDQFIRTSGLNLANPLLESGTINTSGQEVSDSGSRRMVNYIYFGNATTIYFKRNESSVNLKARWYDENKTFVSTSPGIGTVASATLTPPSNARYLRLCIDNNNDNYFTQYGVMVSTEDIPYEPYGTNEWYIKKNIGKVVLDGSESWFDEGGGAPYTLNITNSLLNISNSDLPNLFTNYYQRVSYNSTWTNYNYLVSTGPVSSPTKIKFRNTDIASLSDWTTWLSNNNTTLYYVLATPTYTQITGTLAEQLENIYKMLKSYKGQTNISQVNNDLPFNLDVQAIEDLE